jgi:hypothetical protein
LSVVVDCFNIVLNSRVVPTDWCIGIIQPIYKNKGSIDDPENYRGMTLHSCISKLFTACLNTRLSLFVEGAGLENDIAMLITYLYSNHE